MPFLITSTMSVPEQDEPDRDGDEQQDVEERPANLVAARAIGPMGDGTALIS